jgi:hypothetical protein
VLVPNDSRSLVRKVLELLPGQELRSGGEDESGVHRLRANGSTQPATHHVRALAAREMKLVGWNPLEEGKQLGEARHPPTNGGLSPK